MNRDRLREHLATLRQELRDTTSVDAESRRLMDTLIKDIDRVLEASPAGAQHGGLRDRLEELLLRFEAKHPAIATSMHELIDALARAGI
jgi:hypothetical protein